MRQDLNQKAEEGSIEVGNKRGKQIGRHWNKNIVLIVFFSCLLLWLRLLPEKTKCVTWFIIKQKLHTLLDHSHFSLERFLKIFIYKEVGEFEFLWGFSFHLAENSVSSCQLKSPVEPTVEDEGVSCSAGRDCWVLHSSPGLMPPPPMQPISPGEGRLRC